MKIAARSTGPIAFHTAFYFSHFISRREIVRSKWVRYSNLLLLLLFATIIKKIPPMNIPNRYIFYGIISPLNLTNNYFDRTLFLFGVND